MKPDNHVIKNDAHAMEVDNINKQESYACAIILVYKLITTYIMRFSLIWIQIRSA